MYYILYINIKELSNSNVAFFLLTCKFQFVFFDRISIRLTEEYTATHRSDLYPILDELFAPRILQCFYKHFRT